MQSRLGWTRMTLCYSALLEAIYARLSPQCRSFGGCAKSEVITKCTSTRSWKLLRARSRPSTTQTFPLKRIVKSKCSLVNPVSNEMQAKLERDNASISSIVRACLRGLEKSIIKQRNKCTLRPARMFCSILYIWNTAWYYFGWLDCQREYLCSLCMADCRSQTRPWSIQPISANASLFQHSRKLMKDSNGKSVLYF